MKNKFSIQHILCFVYMIIVFFSCKSPAQEKWYMFTGYKIGTYTNTIVIGTTYGDLPGGYITFFEYDSKDWEQTAIFDLSQLANGYRGPVSIQVNDCHAVIGLDGKRGTPGAILHLYKENGKWKTGSLFQAVDKEADDMFGFVTSLYKNTLAVGVSNKDNARGRVYLYDLSTMTPILIQELTNKYGNQIESLGSSVHLHEDRLAVGVSGYNYERNKTAEDKLPQGKLVFYKLINHKWIENQTLYDFNGHRDGFYLGKKVFFNDETLITCDLTEIFSFTKNSETIFDNPVKMNTDESRVLRMVFYDNWLAFCLSHGSTSFTGVNKVALFKYNGNEWIIKKEFLDTEFENSSRLHFGEEIAIYENILLITDPGNDPDSFDSRNATLAPGKVHIIRLEDNDTFSYEGTIIRGYDNLNQVYFDFTYLYK